jgi:hypothetical protein
MRPRFKPNLFILFVLLAGLLEVGCASMSYYGSYQPVLVRSEPPGATIMVDGKEVGRTPRYVLVRNRKHPTIDLQNGTSAKEITLDTKYRWDSFFSNFAFLIYAPVGWGIDLLSGKAWNIADSPVVEFKTSDQVKNIGKRPKSKAEPKEPLGVAIAPPRADSLSISDTSAKSLEQQIPLLLKNISVRPYESTLPIFIAHGYDFDSPISEANRRDLYYALGVDAIYESEVSVRGNFMTLDGKLRNVYNGETSSPEQLKTYSPDIESSKSYLSQLYHRLIPNNLGIDFVTEKLQVTQGSQTYLLEPAPENRWWEQGLQYITAIDISNLPPRRESHSFRALWGFVPSLRFSRKRVFLSGAPSDDNQVFSRLLASSGYGIEGGIQIARHYFYADLIPLLYWSQISWKKDGQDFSTTDTGLGLEAEFGYLYFIGSHWNARLFTRSVTEDSPGWAEALSNSLSRANGDVSVTTQMVGVTLAYRFDINPGRAWNKEAVSVSKGE